MISEITTTIIKLNISMRASSDGVQIIILRLILRLQEGFKLEKRTYKKLANFKLFKMLKNLYFQQSLCKLSSKLWFIFQKVNFYVHRFFRRFVEAFNGNLGCTELKLCLNFPSGTPCCVWHRNSQRS